MLENMIIKHCAPTLAGLKTANLFNYKYFSIDDLMDELLCMNRKLNRKGVYIEIIGFRKTRALIYVYRKKQLEEDLNKDGVRDFLLEYGYYSCELQSCLEQLKLHIKSCDCFPHEIGIYLGYPLLDVIGFIEHGGKNCKYCGVWKVYSNECEARELFSRFRICTEAYLRAFQEGKTLLQLTVAA